MPAAAQITALPPLAAMLGCATVMLLALGDSPAIRLFAAQSERAQTTAEAAFEEAARLVARGWIADEANRAAAKYEEALAIWRRAGDVKGEARALHALGELHSDLGDYQKVLEFSGRALDVARRAGDRDREAAVLALLGVTHSSLGQYQKALGFTEESLRLYQALGLPAREAEALRLTGLVLYRLGEHERSLDRQTQSLALARAIGDIGQQAGALTFTAWAQLGLRRYTAALATLDEALPLARAAGNRFREAMILHTMGAVHSAQGQLEQAVPFYEQAFAIRHANGFSTAELVSRFRLAQDERALGRLAQARVHIDAALALVETIRQRVAVDDLRATYQASKRRYYDFYVSLLLQMHDADPHRTFDAIALETSERARARSLVDLIAEQRIDIVHGLPPELKDRERAVHARLARAQRGLSAAQEEGASADALSLIDAAVSYAEREREQLEWEIRGRYRAYADLRYPAPPTLSQIQDLLDADTALLEYVLAPDGSTMFVVSRDGLRTYRLPPAAEIAGLVGDLRTSIDRPGRRSVQQYVRSARRLYEVLIAPAAAVLDEKRTLLVAADLALNHLPFEALLTSEPPAGTPAYAGMPFVVNRWTLSYVPSAGALASLRRRSGDLEWRAAGEDKSVVIIGDPVMRTEAIPRVRGPNGSPARPAFAPLPGARDEIDAIAKRYSPSDVALYVRAAAREENVKANEVVATARRVHFATHGIVDDVRPERSALVLTHESSSSEDGLLQVYEIFNLKLRADIVVLSACRTALGRDAPGEGVMGITRAFLYAGASSVAASLWPVADRSTADLMATFYERMGDEGPKARALREAKLALIADGRWAHPYYWAPFVLVGEPN